ncbi:MAG: CHASE2 domain-containing protein [Acidobacteriota bacterium]
MRSKNRLYGALAGALASVVALVLWTTGVLDAWEFATWRWRVQLFAGPSAATENIKIILLDQGSLAWGDKENGWSWPWPREVYGAVIDFCARSGAKVVVFDMLFTEPSLYGVPDDQALAAAVNRAPAFVVALDLKRKSGAAQAWPPEVPHRLECRLVGDEPRPGFTEEMAVPFATFPVGELCASSAVFGGVFQEPDFDGTMRRAHLFHLFDGHVVPTLGLAAYLAATPHSDRTGIGINGGSLRVADLSVPVDPSGKSILRYRGPVGTFDTFSAASVIQSELRILQGEKPVIEKENPFKDCYVFFGTSAPGLLDLRPTPVSRVSPGVEIHATMLDNLLTGDFLREAPWWAVAATTLLLCLVSAMVVVSGRTIRHSAFTVAVFLSVPVTSGFLAYPAGWAYPIMVQEIAVALALTGGVFLNYASEGRQKAFLKTAFRHYLSPAVIEKILEDPSRLDLGGERRELSIFFSDLQGFSSISERLDPHELTALLNEYLSDMTDIILEEGGTLDKYEGDAIIAFWNAPLDQADHAARACRTAVRCQMKLAERREEFLKKTGAALYMRIGINTGVVVVGNMGSRKRFDYTVLGDAANLASRLEGANKVFGTYTMVSETTFTAASKTQRIEDSGAGKRLGEFRSRELGSVRVVGRKTPVRVFELLEPVRQEDDAGLETFRKARTLFEAGQMGEALALFETLPDDPAARAYSARCRKIAEKPDEPWDWVWNLTEK